MAGRRRAPRSRPLDRSASEVSSRVAVAVCSATVAASTQVRAVAVVVSSAHWGAAVSDAVSSPEGSGTVRSRGMNGGFVSAGVAGSGALTASGGTTGSGSTTVSGAPTRVDVCSAVSTDPPVAVSAVSAGAGPSSPTTPVASSAGSDAVTRLRYPIPRVFRGAGPCRHGGVADGRIVSTTTGVRRAGLRGSESRFDRRT